MDDDTRYWLIMLVLGATLFATATVALCGLLASRDPSCTPPAHVEEHRS